MPYSFYSFLHIGSVILLVMSLVVVIVHRQFNNKSSRAISIIHGLAMALIIVSGFGLLARAFAGTFPGWAIAKLVVWLLLGGVLAVFKRTSLPVAAKHGILYGLVLIAISLVVFKPGT